MIEVPADALAAVDATLRAFADACTAIREVSDATGIRARFKLHHAVYQDVRARFALSSNLTCQAIARVAGGLKAGHKRAVFHPTSVSYDQRTFRFREQEWTVTLTMLGGALRFKLLVGDHQRRQLIGQTPTSATLVRRRNGSYHLQIQIKRETPAPKEPQGVLGVDLGIKNLASLSTGERFGGAEVERIRDRAKVRKIQRHRHHRWAFRQLRGFLEYKAIREGVELTLVNAAYTSKTCHRCLHIGDRHGEVFRCGHCGYVGHADYNGARNISLLGVCVTHPEHSLSCAIAG